MENREEVLVLLNLLVDKGCKASLTSLTTSLEALDIEPAEIIEAALAKKYVASVQDEFEIDLWLTVRGLEMCGRIVSEYMKLPY
jgi:hypothetical protein